MDTSQMPVCVAIPTSTQHELGVSTPGQMAVPLDRMHHEVSKPTSTTDAMIATESQGGAARRGRRKSVMKEKIVMKGKEKRET